LLLIQELPNRADNDIVVASPTHCYIFAATNVLPPSVRTRLKTYFGIRVRSLIKLTSLVAAHLRQDLLIGRISWAGGQIAMATGALSIDPRSSTIAAAVTGHLGLGYRQSVCQGGMIRWSTPVADVIGRVPDVLFHGTSDTVLSAIRTGGLITSAPSHWPLGSKNVVCLTATPQIGLKHAREAAARRGGDPIVIACAKPAVLGVDWDVNRQLVQSKRVPSTNGWFLTQEAGLFSTPHPIPLSHIQGVYSPDAFAPFSAWPRVP
jgi:hypothetical protein